MTSMKNIKVGFENPVRIKQVSIAENWGAGAVVRILAYDSTDREYIIHENKEDGPTEKGRMWNIIIPQTEYKVHAIKLIVAPAKIPNINPIIFFIKNECFLNKFCLIFYYFLVNVELIYMRMLKLK
mgnify:CR=1 FL=1